MTFSKRLLTQNLSYRRQVRLSCGGRTISLTIPTEVTLVLVSLAADPTLTNSESSAFGADYVPLDAEMVEVAMLLPRWQAIAFQTAAKKRGMTPAQMLRRLIAATVGAQPPSPLS